LLAAAALCSGEKGTGRWGKLATFVSGLCVGYLLLWAFYGVLVNVTAYSSYVYGALGISSLVAGVFGLLRTHRCMGVVAGCRSHGAPFLFGSVLVFVNSPCCGPLTVAAGFVGLGSAFNPVTGAAFAIGHALPVLGVGFGSISVERLLGTYWHREAATTIGGALAIAMGAYYGVLT